MKRTRLGFILLIGLLLALVLVPTLTVQADFGANWTATFYNNTNLSGNGISVPGIAQINFNWDVSPPSANNQAIPGLANCVATAPPLPSAGDTSANCENYFSVRFTGNQPIVPGTYNFVVSSDDGVRVFINGALVLDRFSGRPLTTDTFTQTITTSPTNITVEYFEGVDKAVIQFQWFLVSGSTTPLPGTPFFTPTPIFTAVPPLSGGVVGVKGLAVRSGPYLGASLITVARPGNTYNPIARNTDEGQYTWYLINLDAGKSGWVSGRYLELTGDPNSIPLQSTIFEQIDGAPDVGAIAVPRSVMNLRRRPSQRSQLLAQIPWGAEIPLIGRTIQGGQNFWFQVRYEGQVGWIYAPYVGVRGDLNAVPIR